MEISTWYVNSELVPEEIAHRKEAAQEWADSMYAVIEKTQDQEALELLNGALSGIAIGRPDTEKHLVPIQGPEQPTVVFVPLFSEDTDINDTTRMMMDQNLPQAALYTENTPGRIYFNAQAPLSPMLKGILMLHEAKHAELHGSNQFREGQELDHWHEEVAAFEFEFRLLRKLCGKQYEDLINNLVPYFIEVYGGKDGQVGALPRLSSIDTALVDEVFGVSHSEHELRITKSIVWVDVAFRMWENTYADTAERDKATFLRQIYAQ